MIENKYSNSRVIKVKFEIKTKIYLFFKD